MGVSFHPTRCISDSPGIPDIFLTEIEDTSQTGSQIRIGYFAVCSSQNSTKQLCSSTYGQSSAALAGTLLVSENLIQYALDVERALFPPFLAAAGVLFVLGLIWLSFLRISARPDAKSNNMGSNSSSRNTSITFGLVWLSTAITLVVAYTTTLTLSALVFARGTSAQSTFQATRGTTLEALQWLIFGFSVLFALGFSRIMKLHSSGASNMQGGGGQLPMFNPPPPGEGPPPPPFN
ncbi:hypothetical protein N431DRAFT_518214 [Stipitochalara longipes BDJ]|nr:hypothetical protein N431DRAFT_518214 [Stipitochalara longipes BDJ]